MLLSSPRALLITFSKTRKTKFLSQPLTHDKSYLCYRWQFLYSPIGAREWAKQDSGYLKKAKCWQPCGSLRVIGDVIAKEGHVGIVTGEQQTTSASAITNTVVQNTWGFTGSKPTCWRYQFTKKNC